MRRLTTLILFSLAVAACRRGTTAGGPATAGPAPTNTVDSTRSEGPPITFEELERAIVGRWRLDPGNTDPQMAQEFQFFPNGTWVTPSFRGYGGKFHFEDAHTLVVRQETTNSTARFQFTLVGDELRIQWRDRQEAVFRRVKLPTPSPSNTPASEPASGEAGGSSTAEPTSAAP
jgi:hypothetical protein